MKVIAITERGEEIAIAVVQIPEGQTAEQTFVAWARAGCDGGHSGYDLDDDPDGKKFLENNTEYGYAELDLMQISV